MKGLEKMKNFNEKNQLLVNELVTQKKEITEKLEKIKKENKTMSYSALFNNELKIKNIEDRIDYLTTGKSNYKALNFFKKECYIKALDNNKGTCKFIITKDNILNVINFSFIVENGIFQLYIRPIDRETFLLNVVIDITKMKNSEIRYLNLNYGLNIPLNVEVQNFDELEKSLLIENGTNLY